jgi:hypothetical protein
MIQEEDWILGTYCKKASKGQLAKYNLKILDSMDKFCDRFIQKA